MDEEGGVRRSSSSRKGTALITSFLLLLPSLVLAFDLVASYEVEVVEPSGLAYDPVRDVLYTVSDEGGPIYVLSKRGEILERIGHFEGDLEGIAYDPRRDLFYIAEERSRGIIIFDRKDGKERRIEIDLLGHNRLDNEGIEGVAINPKNGHLFVVKERSPHFVLEVDADGRPVQSFTLQDTWDFTGLHYDPQTGHLLILSRGSQKVYEATPSGELKGEILSFEAFGAEGLVRDRQGNLYLVTDGNRFFSDRLLVFKERH